jgi:hypothetical protein
MRMLIGQLIVKEKVHALSSTQLGKLKKRETIFRVGITLLCSHFQSCGHQSVMGVLSVAQHQ